jgi:hypothetical protein
VTRLASRLNDELPDAEAALDHQARAEIQDCGRDQLADQLDRLAPDIAEIRDPEARPDVLRELLLPAPLHLGFDRHRLQGLDAGHGLDQEGLVLGAARELLVEPTSEDRRQPGRDPDVEREGPDHHSGQQR